jgi:hypothetical protein
MPLRTPATMLRIIITKTGWFPAQSTCWAGNKPMEITIITHLSILRAISI